MSNTYIDLIDNEYDTWCQRFGFAIIDVVNTIVDVPFEHCSMGDAVEHTIERILPDNSIQTDLLNINVTVDQDNNYQISIWSDNSIIPLQNIVATDDIKVAYDNMMLGASLWHATQTLLESRTPTLDVNYNP